MVGWGRPEDTASEFEKSLRLWVGTGQQCVPVTLFGAFVFHLIGVQLPVLVSGLITMIVALIGIVTYFFGTWLCLRMPGFRKVLAICSYTLVVLSSLSMMSMETAARQAELPGQRLKALQESATYKRVQAQLSMANEDLAQLIFRTSQIPGDQRTQAAALEQVKQRAREEIASLGEQLNRMELSTVGATDHKATGPFDLFGEENSEAMRRTILILLTFGNEFTGLSLLIPLRERRSVGPRMITDGVARKQLPGPVGSEARLYFDTARRLGKDGRLAGYRRVATELRHSTHQARSLMKQCIDSGLIREGRAVEAFDSTPKRQPAWRRLWLSILNLVRRLGLPISQLGSKSNP